MSPSPQALLLVSFGGPEGPDDVLPFMENVTRGRGIPADRLVEVGAHYMHFGGVSPINAQNRALIEALTPLVDVPIFGGNRNWKPYLGDAIREMAEAGIAHAAAFVTSAFSSYSGCRQYLDDIDRARAEVGLAAPTVERLSPFFSDPGFIDPMRDNVAVARANAAAGARLVFTAHSIPQSMASTSRYEAELRSACALVAGAEPWDLVFQSRSGPPSVPWLEPDVNDHLRNLRSQGETSVVVVPIGFVSDHMEVLWDLDTQARATAAEIGLGFARAATVGTDERFVAMIAARVNDRVQGREPAFACPADCCPAPSGARPLTDRDAAPPLRRLKGQRGPLRPD